MRWQTIPYLSFLNYVCAMFILLAKRIDALLSILGHRPLNREGPHLSRYTHIPHFEALVDLG